MIQDNKLLKARTEINRSVSNLHKSFFGSNEDLKAAIEQLHEKVMKMGSEFELYLKRCEK